MGSERKEEAGFSQDIDIILSGEQVRTDSETTDEYAGEVDFARKVKELRAVPSPAFQEQLKHRLLSKLAEEEVRVTEKERAGSFLENLRNVFWRSPAWRTATVTVALAVVALVVVWRVGVFAPQEQGMLTTPPKVMSPSAIPPAPVSLDVSTQIDKRSYLPGERVVIELSFRNLTEDELLFEAFPPEVSITGPLPEETVIFSFPAKGPARILPGDVFIHSLTWEQRRTDGSLVPVGEYEIKIGEIKLEEGKGTAVISSIPVIRIVTSETPTQEPLPRQ